MLTHGVMSHVRPLAASYPVSTTMGRPFIAALRAYNLSRSSRVHCTPLCISLGATEALHQHADDDGEFVLSRQRESVAKANDNRAPDRAFASDHGSVR